MEVKIVDFPETRVAALEHRGAPELEHETARRFIEWRKSQGIKPDAARTYGLHYDDSFNTKPEDHRVDLCVTFDAPVAPNPQGVVNKVLPARRCAVARHVGPRDHIPVAAELVEKWLPSSGEKFGGFPLIFHYVNVGPNVKPSEMITDVYLPLG